MTSLQRTPIPIPDPLESEITIDPVREELAARAAGLLGYEPLARHLRDISVGAVEKRSRQRLIAQLFQQMEIVPFDVNAVADYKRTQQRAVAWRSYLALPAWAKIWMATEWLFTPFIKHDGLGIPSTILCGIGAIACLICAVVGCFLDPGERVAPWRIARDLAVFPLIIVTMIYNGALDKTARDRGFYKVWSWKQISMRDYARLVQAGEADPVPDFALHTAVRISEKMPGAMFFIDQLTGDVPERSSRWYDSDPFLVLEYYGQDHHLEAWDESDFERTL